MFVGGLACEGVTAPRTMAGSVDVESASHSEAESSGRGNTYGLEAKNMGALGRGEVAYIIVPKKKR